MLKLHGFDVSNYYNMAKCVLISKQAPFEAVTVYPSQDADYLDISPMGKVPVLETEHGFLSETNVIIEYLDETLAGHRFYPQEAFARAEVRELAKLIEIYIELRARRCYPEVYFGGRVSDETKAQSRDGLLKGVAALQRSPRFSPYRTGDPMTSADVTFLSSIELAAGVAKKLFDVDLFDELPGTAALLQRLKENDAVRQVMADRDAAMADFQKYVTKSTTK